MATAEFSATSVKGTTPNAPRLRDSMMKLAEDGFSPPKTKAMMLPSMPKISLNKAMRFSNGMTGTPSQSAAKVTRYRLGSMAKSALTLSIKTRKMTPVKDSSGFRSMLENPSKLAGETS
jgi:hypothetical protein